MLFIGTLIVLVQNILISLKSNSHVSIFLLVILRFIRAIHYRNIEHNIHIITIINNTNILPVYASVPLI